ncbi:MAG: hypothetical protein WCJ72_10610 [Chryseobacterium sp.]
MEIDTNVECIVSNNSGSKNHPTNETNLLKESLLPPPPPPPAPATDLGIRFQIYKLQEQIETLEMIISEPQIIAVTGVQNLRNRLVNTWKDKLLTLLYEANVPYFWTIDIVPDDDDHIDPNLAYIYFLNQATKTKAVQYLTDYLLSEYNTQVYII